MMQPFDPAIETSSSAQPERAAGAGVKLTIARFAGSLALASTATLSLLGGMVLVLCLGSFLILNSEHPGTGLVVSIAITLFFSIAAFFISPWIMDAAQKWLYKTHWIDLDTIRQRSPETAEMIQRVCTEKGLLQPRLGLIDDQNPTAFTYGSLPNSARIVVSEGLFTYLDNDEIAAVYAHELGHIIHWDFAIMTMGSTLIQICYLFFIFTNRTNEKIKDVLQVPGIIAYIFYLAGTYLLLYLSRIREYYADHFSAEITGNPNGLSRSLVKIAYGIVEEGKRAEQPSRLLEGTRALGICDAKAAVMTGTAYRISSSSPRLGRVFLWDMFNPWAWWTELNSTHPLTGKRIRALANYAEQLDLNIEFDLASVMREGYKLSKKRLYGGFALDLVLYSSEILGLLLGLILGVLVQSRMQTFGILIAFPLIGYGTGILIKAMIMYPKYSNAPTTDILELMADPYASPLRGIPAQLQGTLIGRGNAGNVFGSDLQFQDKSGLLFLHYTSILGPIGNFLFGMRRAKRLIGSSAAVVGWFRRGAASYLDVIQIRSDNEKIINSYHRLWSFLLGGGLIVLGLVFSAV
jgi:Zn-dependent protease with chaperone function